MRIVALLYAATFFVLGPLAALLSGDGPGFFASPLRWSPPIAGIVTALAVVGVSVTPRFPARTVLLIGLLFETAEGSFYYVMERLDGFDLDTLVERSGPVPVDRALHVLSQVCHSLGEAHTRGLIHRDIKPANVFVCRYGREVDFVKVLDFGLVKPLGGDESTTQVDLTAAHVARGTPAFMAPEQAIGDRPVDTRADLYALGCLAYWLVTGQRVFDGHTALDTLVKHAHTAPSAPSQRTELPIPGSFDDLVLACLAKDPAARPQTADAVAERLAAISAGPAWTQARARDWWELHAPASPSTGFDLNQASPPAADDRPPEDVTDIEPERSSR